MMLKGANSNEVVNNIKAKIPTIQKSLPDDVVIEPFLDRTDLVEEQSVPLRKPDRRSVDRYFRSGYLPWKFKSRIDCSFKFRSLLFALGMMNVFGVSANLMSLGAIDFG
jgi:cobalt-zinc-cadmium resistance protein CzcA